VPEEIDRLENVQELLNGIKEFTESAVTNGEPSDIATWLQSVSLLTDQDMEKPEDRDKVTLMTIHSAKGLEFKYLYIVGLEENLFPSAMNIFNPRELEEERRLFYVAITRACRRVTLSYALNRYKWGTLERSSPSRFIGEIESEFLSFPQTGGKPFGQRAMHEPRPGTETIEQPRPFTPPARMTKLQDAKGPSVPSAGGNRRDNMSAGRGQGNFASQGQGSYAGQGQGLNGDLEEGDRVMHERFGEGEVISVEGESPNTTALINFKTAGTKKLLLRFAKLTKL